MREITALRIEITALYKHFGEGDCRSQSGHESPPKPRHPPAAHATLESGAPDLASEIRLRQAAYLHTIIAALLNDQVAGLPETAPIIR